VLQKIERRYLNLEWLVTSEFSRFCACAVKIRQNSRNITQPQFLCLHRKCTSQNWVILPNNPPFITLDLHYIVLTMLNDVITSLRHDAIVYFFLHVGKIFQNQ